MIIQEHAVAYPSRKKRVLHPAPGLFAWVARRSVEPGCRGVCRGGVRPPSRGFARQVSGVVSVAPRATPRPPVFEEAPSSIRRLLCAVVVDAVVAFVVTFPRCLGPSSPSPS